MSKQLALAASRHHVVIYDEDWQFLNENFGIGTAANLGPGVAAREIIHKRVMQLRERQNTALSARPPLAGEAVAEVVAEARKNGDER